MIEPSPLLVRADAAHGLFTLVDEIDAENLRAFLTEDEFEFSFNPPGAEHLSQPGKMLFVFGQQHPRVVADALELSGMDVVIDPDVVITEDLYHSPVRQLLSLGEFNGKPNGITSRWACRGTTRRT